MKASVLITLPENVCELTTAEKLRGVKYILSAYMVKHRTVTVSYNGKKLTTEEIFKHISKNKIIKLSA
jgi:hypothetical protein